MDFKTPLVFLVALLVLYCAEARSLHKRAAFYIANETACVVDNIVYYNGDPIPTDDPCEACKCRPPGFACVLRECEVKPGCRAVRRAGHCCPDYVCGCEHNGRMYRDGDEIRDSQNPCYTCHCQGSAIACAFVDCFFRVDCAPNYVQGECCPRYDHCSPLDPQTNISYPGASDAAVPTIFSTLKPSEESTFTEGPHSSVDITTHGDIVNTEITTEKASTEIVSSPKLQTDAAQSEDALGNINGVPTSLFYIPREGSDQGPTTTAVPVSSDAITEQAVLVTDETPPKIEIEKKVTTDVSKSSESPTTIGELISEESLLENANTSPKDVEFFAPSEIPNKAKENLLSPLELDTEQPYDSTASKEVIIVTTISAQTENKADVVEEKSTTTLNEIDDLAIPSTVVPLPVFLNKDSLQEDKTLGTEDKPLTAVNTEKFIEKTTQPPIVSEDIASTLQNNETTPKPVKEEALFKSPGDLLGTAEKANSNDNTVEETTLKLDTINVVVSTTTSIIVDESQKETTKLQNKDSTDFPTKSTKLSALEVSTEKEAQSDATTIEIQTSTFVPTSNENVTELKTTEIV